MNRLKLQAILAAGLIAIGVILPGCGGGGAKLETQTRSTTLGQELVDLEAAYSRGIISEEEYQKAREALLERE